MAQFLGQLKVSKVGKLDWYDEVLTWKLLYNQSRVYLCKEGDEN